MKHYNLSQIAENREINRSTVKRVLYGINPTGKSNPGGNEGWTMEVFDEAYSVYVTAADYTTKQRHYRNNSSLSSVSNKPIIQPNYELGCDIHQKRQQLFIQAIQELASNPEQLDKIMIPIFYPNGIIDKDTQEQLDAGIGYLWSNRE